MFKFNMSSNNLWNDKPKPIDIPVTKHIFNNDVRYFSSLDAEIFFNGEFVDDINTIGFQLQQNIMPLFGYNSYIYDDVAVGSRFINGQFIINFTNSSHMINVLNKLISNNTKKILPDSDLEKRKNNPILNYGFNIILNYGKTQSYPNFNVGQTNLSIQDVHIVGFSQQLNLSGDPICEVYSFIAKDIVPIEVNVSTTNNNTESDNTSASNKKEEKATNTEKSKETIDETNQEDEKFTIDTDDSKFNIKNLKYLQNENCIILNYDSNITIDRIFLIGKSDYPINLENSSIKSDNVIFELDKESEKILTDFIDNSPIKKISVNILYYYKDKKQKEKIASVNHNMTIDKK